MRPLFATLAAAVGCVLAGATSGSAQGWPHTAVIEPGDVSPLAPPPDGPRPFRYVPPPSPDPVLRQELNRLESRAVAAPERKLPAYQLRRDLEVARQELRSAQTRDPEQPAVRVYQEHLDWIDRLQRSAAARRLGR